MDCVLTQGSTSFAVQSKAYADAAEAPDPLSTEEGSATWAQIQDYIKDATPEEKEMAEWVPVPEPFCPKTYFYNMKRYLACRRYALETTGQCGDRWCACWSWCT